MNNIKSTSKTLHPFKKIITLVVVIWAATIFAACNGSGGSGGGGSTVNGNSPSSASPTTISSPSPTSANSASPGASATPSSTASVTAQLPQTGDVIVAGGVISNGSITNSAEFFSAQQKKFFTTGSMTQARAGADAQWFVQSPERTTDQGAINGGISGNAAISNSTITLTGSASNTADLYNPANGTFGLAPTTMVNGRVFSATIEFPANLSVQSLQGHALIVGGLCDATALSSCRSANIQHPDDAHFSTTSDPKVATFMHALTLLNDGTVLRSGGIDDFACTTTNGAELFTPSNEFFTTLSATMNQARAGHTATLLNDGTVLIAGGFRNVSGTLTATNTAELYSPGSQTFTALSSNLNQARGNHTAILLSDGSVLIAGGASGTATFSVSGSSSSLTITWTQTSGSALDTAEIYNPTAKTFTCVGGSISGGCAASMNAARVSHTATSLSGGDVLVVGGLDASLHPLNTAEVFHAGAFTATPPMNQARAYHGAMAVQP